KIGNVKKGVIRMKLSVLCGPIVALASVAMLSPSVFAQDEDAQRAKLNGSWQGTDQAVWTIQGQSGGIRLTHSQCEKKLVEIVCSFGKECDAKDEGKKVKITFFYAGPKLVVMEINGDSVVKRSFGFGQAGDVMELETVSVAPAGKGETVTFTRVAT